MKKVLLYALILISMVSIVPSCTKEDTKLSAKEEVVKLLTTGRWYYQERYRNGVLEADCFNKSHFFLFSPDGTMIASYTSLQSGVYSVDENGIGMSITLDGEPKIVFTSVMFSESNSKLSIEGTFSSDKVKIVLSKTPKSCVL